MCINFQLAHLITFCYFVYFSSKMSFSENISESSDPVNEDGKNWAVIPYNLTQNMLFPTFNEKIRKFKFDGIEDEIVIEQNWDEQGVSAVVWEAAIELTKYIIKNKSLKGKRLLEIGAGTGLVGICCAKLGAQVTATDLKEALPFLSRNINQNFAPSNESAPTVKELKWGDKLQNFSPLDYDIIIGADVVYIEDSFEDLLDTICYLSGCEHHRSVMQSSKLKGQSGIGDRVETSVILSAKMRYSREKKFINRMKKYFQVYHVLSINSSNIHIYEAKPL